MTVELDDLPDFAYFDHSIHVAKGVGCSSCHGQVDEMPLMWQEHSLTMEWCLDCHRNPEEQIRPREAVFDMDWMPGSLSLAERKALVEDYDVAPPQNLTSCSTCHR